MKKFFKDPIWEMVEQPIEEIELRKKMEEADEEEEFTFSADKILYDPDEEKEYETKMWDKMQAEARIKKIKLEKPQRQ